MKKMYLSNKLLILFTLLSITSIAQIDPELAYREKQQQEANAKDAERKKIEQLLSILPVVDGELKYEEVVQVDSLTKANELYSRAKKWMVENFRDRKAVIEVDDKENFKIIGKGNAKFKFLAGPLGLTPYNERLEFIISIAAKDGKYRYQIYNFSLYQSSDAAFTPSTVNIKEELEYLRTGKNKFFNNYRTKLFYNISEIFLNLTASFKKSMNTKDDF